MYIYGKNAVNELLKSDYKVKKIVISSSNDFNYICEIANKKKINVINDEKNNIDKLVDANSQGIAAEIEDFKKYTIENIVDSKKSEHGLIVVLDQITDVNNFASIIRVCECAGVDGIIIPKDRSVTLSSSVGKISSGAIFNTKICTVTNINQALKKLKDLGFWVFAGDLQGNSEYTDVDYNLNVALVIGSEGKGIRDSVRKSCDFLLKIPMYGEVNSLNAGVACGILTYQILNMRKE